MTEEITLVLDDDLVKEATAIFAEYGLTFELISRAFPIHVEHMGGVKRDRPS